MQAISVRRIPFGEIRTIPSGEDGLTQFEITGTARVGLLHLGLRPFPGSVLVTEDDQVIDPAELNVEDNLLALTLKVEGAGRIWVVTGTAAGRALEVLAVLEPDGSERWDTAASPGFPSDEVLAGVRRTAGGRSPAWFSRTRVGPWLAPRRDSDLPPLPGCEPPLTAAGLRTCARQTLAAIYDCFATRGMTTRAIPKALAIYLDDRIAYRAARAAGGGNCSLVLTLEADNASQEQAREIVAASFSRQGDAEGAADSGHADPPPAVRSRHEAEITDLMAALDGSCAGRSLIQAIRDSGGTGLETSVSLLVHEVAKSVEAWTGRIPDESDGKIVDAAHALEDLPHGPGCDPVVAVMAMIDEWSSHVAEKPSHNGTHERFIDSFREAESDRGDDLKDWLPERFPLLYRDSRRILQYLA
jgi:hypothetical protein